MLAGSVQAQTFGSINSEFATGLKGASDQSGYLFTIGHKIDNVIVDANAETLVAETSRATVSRLEGGASLLVPSANGITPYVRTAMGLKTVGTKQFGYASIEPGVRIKAGPGTARLAWRYRGAVDSDNADTTRTWRVGYVLPVTKATDFNIAYEQARGDANYNGYMVGLTFRF